MEPSCSFDGEELSRFLDAELAPAAMEGMTEHLKVCPACELRLGQFRLADGLLSRVRSTGARGGIAASVSVAAALVVSLVANLLLNPAERKDPRPPLLLSAAPSDTLASFYERVAAPPSAGSEIQP